MRTRFGGWSDRGTRARVIVAGLLACAAQPITPASGAATYGTGDLFDPGDNIPANARSITAMVPGAGQSPFIEDHTFHEAYNSTSAHDDDWFHIDVGQSDVDGDIVYLIEALSFTNPLVDPAVEVFGPDNGTPPTFPYVHAHTTGGLLGDPNALAYEINSDWFSWPWNSNTSTQKGARLDFRPATPGRYYIRVRPYGDNTGSNYYDQAGPWTLRVKVGTFTRIAGSSRYATAARISQERYPNGLLDPAAGYANLDAVVLASGENFPDALSGSCLAGVVQGPILLCRKNALTSETAAELLRLDPAYVYVLGGSFAVSDGVISEIANAFPPGQAPTVQRVQGSDRIGTAIAIAEKAMGLSGSTGVTPPGFVFIVNGYNFPDALSCSPMAAGNFVPVLQTDGQTLDQRTKDVMSKLSIGDAIIVGGTGAVSTGIETELKNLLGSNRVLRLGGVSRYETSKVFAEWAAQTQTGLVWCGTPGNSTQLDSAKMEGVAVATGGNFPDALAAGPFCGNGWGASDPPHVLLLTPSDSLSPWIVDLGGSLATGKTSYFEDVWNFPGHTAGDIEPSYIFGGSGALSDWVWWQLDCQS